MGIRGLSFIFYQMTLQQKFLVFTWACIVTVFGSVHFPLSIPSARRATGTEAIAYAARVLSAIATAGIVKIVGVLLLLPGLEVPLVLPTTGFTDTSTATASLVLLSPWYPIHSPSEVQIYGSLQHLGVHRNLWWVMGVLLVVNLKGRDKGNDLRRHDADVTAEISVLITVIKKYIVCLKNNWIYIPIIHNTFPQSTESENSKTSMTNHWNTLVFKTSHAQNMWKPIFKWLWLFFCYLVTCINYQWKGNLKISWLGTSENFSLNNKKNQNIMI